MKKRTTIISLFLAVLAIMPSYAAKNTWTLDGKSYDVDTLIYNHQVGPGVMFAKYNLPGMPLLISVLEMDLTNKYIDFETCLGGDRGVASETPVSMSSRNDRPGHEVVGATNGDFYFYTDPIEIGIPRSGQFRRDECVTNPVGRASFVLTDDRKPYIDRVDFAGTVTTATSSVRLHTVNMQRLEWEDVGGNQLTLYTNSYGPQTEACAAGKKAIIVPKSGSFAWTANKDITAVVESVLDGAGVSEIPEGKALLWGQGTCAEYVSNLAPGTEITINLGVNLRSQPGILTDLKEQMGGSDHIILKDGQYVDEWTDRHPRTCIGYDQSGTKVYFVVIDGRNSKSVGVSMAEAAGVFLGIGAWNAVNLDGGGSSCMVVNNAIVNTPSDGATRAVGNGCLLISNAPADDNIAQLGFEPRSYNIPVTGKIKPEIWGYNQYGVLKTSALDNVTFTCDASIGHISEDGYFIASSTPGTGTLTAHYNGIEKSQKVYIIPAVKSLRMKSLLTDKYHPYELEVVGENGFYSDLIDPTQINWQSSDADVCTINENGVLIALNNGTASISGSESDFEGQMDVTVENATLRVQPADPNLDAASWTVSQSGGKDNVLTALDNGLNFKYTGASSRSPYIKLAKVISLWSLPDSLQLRINPGDATIKTISLSLTDNQKNSQNIELSGLASNSMNTLQIPLSDYFKVSDRSIFPIKMSSIYLSMGASTSNVEYNIAIPGIELIYDNIEPSGIIGIMGEESKISLYPNPVTAGCDITISASGYDNAGIEIFNAEGKLVQRETVSFSQGKASIPNANLASGLYFVKVIGSTGTYHTSKMVVV